MSLIVAAADGIRNEFGAATLFVHHSGKDISKGGRGHTSLLGACDVIICVLDKVATIEKVRDGESGEIFPFKLNVLNLGTDQDGESITSCVVEPTTSEMPSKRRKVALSGVAAVALRALNESLGDYGEVMPGTSTIPPGVRAVTIDQWRSQFRIRYGSEDDGREKDTVRKAFLRARNELLKAEAVAFSDPFVWPCC